MINWIPLGASSQLDVIVQNSHAVPCIIFKHSTRCNISAMAKSRFEKYWDFEDEEIQPYFLDLLSFRALSNEIAERFNVYHESPQLLLIRNGECIYYASHLDISVSELRQCFSSSI